MYYPRLFYNMKTRLTAEESAKLIELGVSPERASEIKVEVEEPSRGCPNIYCSEVKHPIFTLADIIDILPKKITFGHRTNCRLKMQPIISSKDRISEVWQACYLHTSLKANAEAPELIDALYSLLVWVIDHKHVRLG